MSEKQLSVEPFATFVPDESTPESAYEGGKRPEHAGTYRIGLRVEGVEVVLAAIKGGELGPSIAQARERGGGQSPEPAEPEPEPPSGEQATTNE